MAKVTMPQLGESVAEGTIGKWLKQPGDHVAKYEPLLEVITDKVNAEVPSPFEGTLTQILVEEGATVPNNAEIAVIATADDGGANGSAPPMTTDVVAETAAAAAQPAPAQAAAAQPAPAQAAAAQPAPAQAAAAPVETASASVETAAAPMPPSSVHIAPIASAPPPVAQIPVAPPAAPAPTEAGGRDDARMTPAVRRLLREHGLAASQIAGTGHGGRITRDDVIAYVEAQRTGTAPAASSQVAHAVQPVAASGASPALSPATPAVEYAPGTDEELIPWTQMRKGVAAQMVRSKTTVPHAYTIVEVDVTNLVRLRDAKKAEYQASEGTSLSYVPFFVKGVVETLKRHPRLNAHWSEEGLLVKRHINIAVAIAVDDGLLTPVIHDADTLSINGLNRALQDLSNRSRVNRLRLDDLQGGTITVNNTGWFGSVASGSIVNTPQIVIVNMEAIVKRPIVVSGPDGDTIAIRSMMNLPVAFDHRATDGAQVGRFVADLKTWLESIGPETPIF